METVALELKKNYYEDYLRWLFNSPEGILNVNPKMNIGKMFNAHLHVSEKPYHHQPIFKDSVRVDLLVSTKMVRSLPQGFFYYPDFVVEQINELIEFYFDLDLTLWCQQGDKFNMQRKHVYASFLKSRKIINKTDIYEMIKKRDYRRRLKMQKILEDNFQNTDFQY